MIGKLYTMQEEIINKAIEIMKVNPILTIQVILSLIAIIVALAIGFSITGSSRR